MDSKKVSVSAPNPNKTAFLNTGEKSRLIEMLMPGVEYAK
jgi:hypothetical protein